LKHGDYTVALEDHSLFVMTGQHAKAVFTADGLPSITLLGTGAQHLRVGPDVKRADYTFALAGGGVAAIAAVLVLLMMKW
jgi:hypothetical protein